MIAWINTILTQIQHNAYLVFKAVHNAYQIQYVKVVNLDFSYKLIMVYQLMFVLNVHHLAYNVNFLVVIVLCAKLDINWLLEVFAKVVKLDV
jgi:hypothetical protein